MVVPSGTCMHLFPAKPFWDVSPQAMGRGLQLESIGC